MSDGSGSTTWTYDNRGRVTKESKTLSGAATYNTSYSYDAADRVKTMTYPGGEVVTTAYNTQGLPQTLTGDATYVTGATYTALGQADLLQFGNGTQTDYIYYDQTGNYRLNKIRTGFPGGQESLRQHLEYAYDNVGNVETITDRRGVGTWDNPQVQEFEYDALDRLTHAQASGGTIDGYEHTYQYNAIGNLTSKAGVSYTYPTSGASSVRPHAVTSTSNGGSFSYDNNGNMTSRRLQSGGTTYSQQWDYENRLKQVTYPGHTTTFTYDGNGALVKKVVDGVTTLYVGSHYEKQGSTIIKYYFFGSQRVAMNKAGVVQYLAGDHLGTTSVVLNADGTLHSQARHYPYGVERWSSGTSPTDYRFTGARQEAALGLYHMGARFYDPSLARWLSADTLVPEPSEPQDLNRYSYVRNSPCQYVDPTGHSCQSPEDVHEYKHCQGIESEILASTVQIKVILSDGTVLWAQGTVMNDYSIMTTGHLPTGDVGGFELWDASGVNRIVALAGGDKFTKTMTSTGGKKLDAMLIEFENPVLAGMPVTSSTKPQDLSAGDLPGREVAQVILQSDSNAATGRRSVVQWANVTDVGKLYIDDDSSMKFATGRYASGLKVDQSIPGGSSGGGAYVVGSGSAGITHIGVNSGSDPPSASYITFNFGLR